MRNKLYFVGGAADLQVIGQMCAKVRVEWHAHTLPDQGKALVMIVEPSASIEVEVGSKFTALPDLFDHTQTIGQNHIDALPKQCNLTLQDTAYTAMKKVCKIMGMAAMNPQG